MKAEGSFAFDEVLVVGFRSSCKCWVYCMGFKIWTKELGFGLVGCKWRFFYLLWAGLFHTGPYLVVRTLRVRIPYGGGSHVLTFALHAFWILNFYQSKWHSMNSGTGLRMEENPRLIHLPLFASRKAIEFSIHTCNHRNRTNKCKIWKLVKCDMWVWIRPH